MGADARDAGIAQNFLELRRRVFRESCKARIGVARWRTQLNTLKSCRGKLLDRAREVFSDHFTDRPRLACNREPQRISAQVHQAGRKEARCSCTEACFAVFCTNSLRVIVDI